MKGRVALKIRPNSIAFKHKANSGARVGPPVFLYACIPLVSSSQRQAVNALWKLNNSHYLLLKFLPKMEGLLFYVEWYDVNFLLTIRLLFLHRVLSSRKYFAQIFSTFRVEQFAKKMKNLYVNASFQLEPKLLRQLKVNCCWFNLHTTICQLIKHCKYETCYSETALEYIWNAQRKRFRSTVCSCKNH